MDESQFKTLRELARDGTLSQRDLSKKMGVSLGRTNFLVNALLKKGYIKAKRFKNSKNKIAYMYIVTPKGIKTKVQQTYGFLNRKMEEYERLKQEIDTLREENEEWLRAIGEGHRENE
jgi:EPS-associated MarR family transcriptional regulator